MTLSKLAKLANVSVSVVSKAFSGREDVSETMREHVFAVAREHGCFQQFYHVPYDKPVVAVIIPEVISEHYIHYLQVLKKRMEESGYTMLLSISNFDPQMEKELVHYYTTHNKTDALILVGGHPEIFPPNSQTALISLSFGSPLETGCRIGYDLQKGIAAALRYLYEQGHRRIAYVGEAFTSSKCVMMEEEMGKLGLHVDPMQMVCSRFRFEEAGYDGARRIWAESKEKPTAIIGAYGYITKGILSFLEENGIRVPEDASVVSMDNDPAPLHPKLDVACIPSGIESLCLQAMELLQERIRSPHPNAPLVVTIPADFCPGNTIAPIQ